MAEKRGEGFILEGEDVQYFWGGSNKGGKAQYTVAPTTSAKQIDFVFTVGQDRYKSRIGIYKLELVGLSRYFGQPLGQSLHKANLLVDRITELSGWPSQESR